ncbi:MAG: pyrroline-5-carboxylate reductase [Verrucomicrobiaceae bacterium]|nr:MAG: pyrroline-5-carboxylate reductase [Verrucomicrobiaceae bacterium]
MRLENRRSHASESGARLPAMKFAFLGAGKMASAIIRGMLRAKVCGPSDIIAACPEPALLRKLKDETSVNVSASNAEAAAFAPAVLFCMKPADVAGAVEQAGAALENKLIVSIVAGVSISSLAKRVNGCRVIRAMPNTAAMVGRAATAYACSDNVTPADVEVAEAVFAGIGAVFPVQEKMLNAVTGLSGSGPAYIYLVIEAMSDGGVACGLPRKLALDLAVQTVIGAAEMLAETSEHPAVLREMVTSPAGTTMAGLRELETRGVRSAIIEAVSAATQRSRELSGE